MPSAAVGVIRQERTALVAKRDEINERIEALDLALKALTGKRSNGGKRGRVQRGPLVSRAERGEQIAKILAESPTEQFSAAQLDHQYGIPQASAHKAFDDLIERGIAVVVGTTIRGTNIVQLKPEKPKAIKPNPARAQAEAEKGPEKPKRGPGELRQAILDLLKRSPKRWWTPIEVADALAIDRTTPYRPIDALIDEDKVTVVHHTPAGKPVIQHKPESVTIIPGEGIVE